MEFLYSDEGQNIWLKGYCDPIRYDDLVKAATRSRPTCTAKLPDITGAVFPTLDQLDAGHDADHQGLGLGRRRRQSSSRPRANSATGHDRDRRHADRAIARAGAPPARPGSRRVRLGWLGARPVLPVRLPVPGPADGLPRRSAASRTARRRAHPPELRRPVAPDHRARRSATSIEISLVTAIAGGIFGFLLAYAVILGGLPTVPAARPHDVLRRRLELRRRPARPGLHLHPRPARRRDRPAQGASASTSTTPASSSTRSSASSSSTCTSSSR